MAENAFLRVWRQPACEDINVPWRSKGGKCDDRVNEIVEDITGPGKKVFMVTKSYYIRRLKVDLRKHEVRLKGEIACSCSRSTEEQALSLH
ncbi:hypothetical protein GN956_G22542 [Arapaima gigas]